MITIKIKNVREIVAKERGQLVARLGWLFTDLERKVEEEVIQQIKAAFDEREIEADISIVREEISKNGSQV